MALSDLQKMVAGMFSQPQPAANASIYDLARADAQRQSMSSLGAGLIGAAVPQTPLMRAQALQNAFSGMGNMGTNVYNAAQMRLMERKQQMEEEALANDRTFANQFITGGAAPVSAPVAASVPIPSMQPVDEFKPLPASAARLIAPQPPTAAPVAGAGPINIAGSMPQNRQLDEMGLYPEQRAALSRFANSPAKLREEYDKMVIKNADVQNRATEPQPVYNGTTLMGYEYRDQNGGYQFEELPRLGGQDQTEIKDAQGNVIGVQYRDEKGNPKFEAAPRSASKATELKDDRGNVFALQYTDSSGAPQVTQIPRTATEGSPILANDMQTVLGYTQYDKDGVLRVVSVPQDPAIAAESEATKQQRIAATNSYYGPNGRLSQANAASSTIASIAEARKAVDAGIFSGPTGAVSENIARAFQVIGVPNEALANTEAFRSAVGGTALQQMTLLGGNDTDREYAEVKSLVGANTQLTDAQIKRVLDLQTRFAARKYEEGRQFGIKDASLPKDVQLAPLSEQYPDVFDEKGQFKGFDKKLPDLRTAPLEELSKLTSSELSRLTDDELLILNNRVQQER